MTASWTISLPQQPLLQRHSPQRPEVVIIADRSIAAIADINHRNIATVNYNFVGRPDLELEPEHGLELEPAELDYCH